jgi:hypothetical protein
MQRDEDIDLKAKGRAAFDEAEAVKPGPRSVLRWHGDKDHVIREWLVERTLPRIGTALFPGPWGSYKTFVVIDLAMAVMLKRPFAGRAVNHQCGVLFIAPEGAFEVPIRLQAAYEESASFDENKLLPFAWIETCPRLSEKNSLKALEAVAAEANQKMQRD